MTCPDVSSTRGTDPTLTNIRCLKSHILMTQQRESLLPLKFLLFILKFRGAKGFEETILPPETRRLVIAVRGRAAAHTQGRKTESGRARRSHRRSGDSSAKESRLLPTSQNKTRRRLPNGSLRHEQLAWMDVLWALRCRLAELPPGATQL